MPADSERTVRAFTALGQIMLAEAGEQACQDGYDTTDPYWVAELMTTLRVRDNETGIEYLERMTRREAGWRTAFLARSGRYTFSTESR